MEKKILKTSLTVIALVSASLLTGCAATQVALEHHNLDVQTRMSKTIFLAPVPDSEHTIFVQLKNTSDKNLDMAEYTQDLDAALVAKGYQVAPYEKARYLLQANILQVGKMDPSAAASMLGAGFGGAVTGIALADAGGANIRGMATGAVVGGVADLVANSLVKNVTYTTVTDVQITENPHNGIPPSVYQTRMLSTANKMNLDFKDAEPKLESQVTHSLAGIF